MGFFNSVIIFFQASQSIWPLYVNVRDRQTETDEGFFYFLFLFQFVVFCFYVLCVCVSPSRRSINITPELLKTAEIPISMALHQLFLLIWKSGKVPSDWKEAVIISLYKGKGSRTICSSYRPISLLSVPGKVFAHVLLEQLQPLLTRQRRPQQSSFTRSRSTINAILTLRLLAELHREFRKPLHVAYIDIKAAFDSVDR